MIGYPVIVEQADDGGFGAWSPDLPGCVALGDTVDECLAEMRDAVALYLEVLRERGEDVPQPRAVQTVTVTPAAKPSAVTAPELSHLSLCHSMASDLRKQQ